MIFILFFSIFYSFLVTGLLVRNHYRYDQLLQGHLPELNQPKEHEHEWTKWKFKNTTDVFSGNDSKEKGNYPIYRDDVYTRECLDCGEPEVKKVRR